jgi:NAD(P)-dependent dehydrogenase (short-subunit alcohol dehydrogenase family)
MGRDSLGGLDFDSLREQFEINALGPLRVVEALVHHLAPGGFVAVITSRMGSIADNGRGGAYGYRMSKAAVNAAGVSLARDLAPKGHPVVLLHPGWVKTDLTGGAGHLTPQESAAKLWARLDEVSMETTGRFLHCDGTQLPW